MGIGTSNPTDRLEVVGNIRLGGQGTNISSYVINLGRAGPFSSRMGYIANSGTSMEIANQANGNLHLVTNNNFNAGIRIMNDQSIMIGNRTGMVPLAPVHIGLNTTSNTQNMLFSSRDYVPDAQNFIGLGTTMIGNGMKLTSGDDRVTVYGDANAFGSGITFGSGGIQFATYFQSGAGSNGIQVNLSSVMRMRITNGDRKSVV